MPTGSTLYSQRKLAGNTAALNGAATNKGKAAMAIRFMRIFKVLINLYLAQHQFGGDLIAPRFGSFIGHEAECRSACDNANPARRGRLKFVDGEIFIEQPSVSFAAGSIDGIRSRQRCAH